MAFAPNVWLLMAAAAFSGLGQGWCNPATNKLIAERVPEGRRGTITGLKQSGVMFGTFLSGATLPTLATLYGWRWATGIYGVVTLVCALGIALWLRPDTKTDSEPAFAYEAPPGAVFAVAPAQPRVVRMGPAERRFIITITWFSLLMGSVVGGVGRFQILFAEESLGWTNFWAGWASALAGVTAIGSRIWWARLTERRVHPASALAIQSAFTVVAMALLLGAATVHSSLIWVMSLLAGFTMMSWNAVAMLAIITGIPVALAGRASGIVMLGFMSGLSIGGLVTGYVAEWTGSFNLVWSGFAVLAAGATLLALIMRRQGRGAPPAPGPGASKRGSPARPRLAAMGDDFGIEYQSGFGNEHVTEAEPGVLPIGQNSPQRVTHDLYTEQLTGSAFTAPRADALRTWMYRIRPSVRHVTALRDIEAGNLRTSPCREGTPPVAQLRWSPIGVPDEPLSWLEGLCTLAANGDAHLGTGAATHLYVANRSMDGEVFANADGEMLILPQQGALRLVTELGTLAVGPAELATVPRGVKFRVELMEDSAMPSPGATCARTTARRSGCPTRG